MTLAFLQTPMEYNILMFVSLLFFYCLLRWKKSNSTKKHPPQASGSWPIIGHLHLMGKLPHISLGKMADKHGPIFMIKLGVRRALVVSSQTMAKECFGINDTVFMGRPQTIFVEHLAHAMFGFSLYGPYWRELRKIAIVELLSNQKVEMFQHVRKSELISAIKDIYNGYCVTKIRKPIDLKKWFNDLSLNTIVRLIAGKPLKEIYQGEKYDKIQKALRDFFELASVVVPADALPFLRWFDLGDYEKTMKTVAAEIDQVAQEWLDEHRKRMSYKDRKEGQDFMDVMLGIYETQEDKPTKGVDTIIKATCMTLIAGAADSTSVTLTWALSLLLNNRDTMKKAQSEIDNVVGEARQVNEADLKELMYLDAVLKETLRLYPAAQFVSTREAIKDCTVNGYHIPASTQLFVNLHKIHRDPDVWPNPLEFNPERFLTTHKAFDVRGQNFAFLPFGSGRRMCPGITLAFKFMMLTLATLLHGFEISTPSDETVDMTEGFGLINMKATPLDVILVPRLPDNLYNPPAVVNQIS